MAGTDSAKMVNYCPVSNLSIMSKVVEQVVANQLTRVPVCQQPATVLPVSLSQEAHNWNSDAARRLKTTDGSWWTWSHSARNAWLVSSIWLHGTHDPVAASLDWIWRNWYRFTLDHLIPNGMDTSDSQRKQSKLSSLTIMSGCQTQTYAVRRILISTSLKFSSVSLTAAASAFIQSLFGYQLLPAGSWHMS